MSLVRIWAIAANGFQEVIRDRILYAIGLFAVLFALALRLPPRLEDPDGICHKILPATGSTAITTPG